MQKSDSPLESNFFSAKWKTTTCKDKPVSQDYIPLPIQNLVPGQEVPFELLLRIRGAGKTGYQFKTCCSPGQQFEPDWLAKLQGAGINRVYFRQQDQDSVLKYLNESLPVVLDDDSLSIQEKAERVADVTYFWVNQLFADTKTLVVQQLKQGFEYVDHLLAFLRQDHSHRHWLMDLYRHDQNLYSHCLNTSLMSMAFASHLGWEDHKIRELGRGSLLHDIGMTRVPAEILAKKGKLTEEEQGQVKKHPYAGFVMLKAFFPISREALLMILQHHENGDGSGYPQGLKKARIHPYARVLRLVDSFDALVSPRSWRPGYPPVKALWIMRQDWQQSGMFDVGLLVELIKFIAGEEK
jgi:HD-GYP domain-containing protein (c-di-GMP phosphodiesterase class II)